MTGPRRYVITDAGEKHYIDDRDDIKYEFYCHVCGHAVDDGKCIQVQLMGGYTDRRIGFPPGMGQVKLHEACARKGLLDLMVPLTPPAEAT
jgi:hypothetical protein